MSREIRVERHRLIRAPIHRVWQVLSRLESHPRYATLWSTADLLERSQTSAVVEFRGFFGGLPITSVQRLTLRPLGRIEYRQIRGTLRGLSGAYLLREVEGDTDLAAQMTADPGIVLFSEGSVRQILAVHLESTLGKIKASVERDLVRPAARRASTGGAAVETPAGAEAASDAGGGEADGSASEGTAELDAVAGASAQFRARTSAPASSIGGRRRRRRRRARNGSSKVGGSAE